LSNKKRFNKTINKTLKKYNESNEEFDLGYIDCFVEFKDDSKYQYEIEEDEHAEPGSYIIE
jgi:hypothetical protein